MHAELDEIEAGQTWFAAPTGGDLVPAEMPGMKDLIAASTRADALQNSSLHDERTLLDRARLAFAATDAHAKNTAGCWETPNTSRVGKLPMRWEIPNTSPEPADSTSREQAGASPVRARHASHGTNHMFHEHEHARSFAGKARTADDLRTLGNSELEALLDDEGSYWASQLTEIFGAESARKFRRTWLLRMCDRHAVEAYRALGEVKRMKLEGETFRLGPGECANDLFHRYKEAVRKSERS